MSPLVRVRDALLDWTLLNLIIGNNSDAHGKNIGFMASAFPVAPFYDLVSVWIETGLAMAIGDQFDPNKITAYDLLSFAKEVGITPALINA